jgi:ubiquinone/menaquinone biosynthesis C-methylase UbiE
MTAGELLKKEVHDHWNQQSCGEGYARLDAGFDLSAQEKARYALEPYIFEFARFEDGQGKDVLEVGVGMGADHLMWARAHPGKLSGIDLTPRAVEFTAERLAKEGFVSQLHVGDAEALPFSSGSFDIVYSWGVMHHSPDTQRCFAEANRVLKKGGTARIMVYNKWSLVGLMLWTRYGLLAGRPLRSMEDVYFHHLESPGTKAYTLMRVTEMLANAGFSNIRARIQLSHGDLLQGRVGARHGGLLMRAIKALWPRPMFRLLASRWGLYLLIEADK